jgi:hypothetical protein
VSCNMPSSENVSTTTSLSTIGSYIHFCNWLISRSGLFSIQYTTRSLFLNNLRQCFPVLVLRTKYLSFYLYHPSCLCLFTK